MKFEDALKTLELIIKKFEHQDLPLEESLKSYEEGSHLIHFCQSELAKVENKIFILKNKLNEPLSIPKENTEDLNAIETEIIEEPESSELAKVKNNKLNISNPISKENEADLNTIETEIIEEPETAKSDTLKLKKNVRKSLIKEEKKELKESNKNLENFEKDNKKILNDFELFEF